MLAVTLGARPRMNRYASTGTIASATSSEATPAATAATADPTQPAPDLQGMQRVDRPATADEQALAATATLPAPIDPTLGHEVIFIVGLPRSGSTLFEQVLAAHPQVEGASELPDLGIVIQQESVRRGVAYPQWVPQASAAISRYSVPPRVIT